MQEPAKTQDGNGENISVPELSGRLRTEDESLSLAILLKIEAICRRYETAWNEGQRRQIEELLTEVPLEGRGRLKTELIDLQSALRAANGERAFRGKVPLRSIAGYEILAELGKGGMGIVYRARQCGLNRQVALKMILAGELAGPEELARFRTEAEAVARLQHPNIVQVFEVGEENGLPFLSLELAEQESLAKKINSTPQSPIEAARMVQTLAQAMDHAHQRGIIHRDLKPANVLLSRDGIPKITDFGLAKRLDDVDQGQTRTGAIFGTPSYMAPEQAQGNTHQVSASVDIYALGAILYEMVTGKPPFKGLDAVETLMMVRTMEPIPPRHLQPKLPIDLETICLKCLQKDSAKRYEKARDLGEDLGRFLANEPIKARPIGRAERLFRWSIRNPVLATTGSLAFFALIVVVIGSLLFAAREFHHASDLLQLNHDLQTKTKLANAMEGIARSEAQNATSEKREKDKELLRANWLVYFGKISLAQLYSNEGNMLEARQSLDSCALEFRGWEYDYILNQINRHQQVFSGHLSKVNALAFSPDGKSVISGGADGWVKMWDPSSAEQILGVIHQDTVHSVGFSPDGKRFASGGWDKTIRVWSATTGAELFVLTGHKHIVLSLGFTSDGKKLVSGSGDGTLKVWDLSTRNCIATLEAHKGNIYCLAISPDGKRVVSGGQDATLKMWELSTGKKILEVKGHRSLVACVAFNPDGNSFVSGGVDKTLILWDSETGNEIRQFKGHTGAITCVAFQPDAGGSIVSGGADKTLKVWKIADGSEIRSISGHTAGVTCVAYSPDGLRIASGGQDNAAKVWDAIPLPTFKGHSGAVHALAFNPDGKYLASGSMDNTLKIWSTTTGQIKMSRKGKGNMYAVAFSNDGKSLASAAAAENTVKIWDVANELERLALKGHKQAIVSIAFSPDDKYVATGSNDNTLRIWDSVTGEVVCFLNGHVRAVTSVAYCPTGKRIVSGSDDMTLKLWDAITGQELFTLKGHKEAVRCVAFSPDGRYIASGKGDAVNLHRPCEIRVWNAKTGVQIMSLDGHTKPVTSVAFSPDGSRLVSGSEDKTMKVWDVATGQETITLKGHAGPVNSVVFSPDGKQIGSASGDRTIRIWAAATRQKSSNEHLNRLQTKP